MRARLSAPGSVGRSEGSPPGKTPDLDAFQGLSAGDIDHGHIAGDTIRGEQPLYYAAKLIIENGVMEETHSCFEYATLNAGSIGEIILNKNSRDPNACTIETEFKAGA